MPMRISGLMIVLALQVSGVSLAQSPGKDGVAGRELYAEYCAGCHGVDGRGGGPDAAKLGLEIPDLTRLHERYGSPLQRNRIAAFIDGREEVKAHGPREMPVWGERFFEGDPGPPKGVESAKRRTLGVLVDYLQTLQGQEQEQAQLAR